MVAKIKKRGRGRPARMDKLLHEMQTSIVKGQEKMTDVYDEAIDLIIAVMRDDKALATTRLNAAKTVREYVESSLVEYEKDDENDNNDEEDNNQGPLLKIE